VSGDYRYIAIAELLGGIGGLLFVIRYTFLTRWGWVGNEYGRNVMLFTAGISFFFLYGPIYYFVEFPKLPPWFMVRIQEVVLTAVVFLLWQRFFQMERAQKEVRKRRRDDNE